jgi:hypothetical protein
LAVFVFIAETPFQILSSGLISLLPCNCRVLAGLVITESGLPGVLFSMLDTETDSRLIKDIHDTLTSMLQMMAADNLSQWLSLCKDVLTVATGQYLFNILCGMHVFLTVCFCFSKIFMMATEVFCHFCSERSMEADPDKCYCIQSVSLLNMLLVLKGFLEPTEFTDDGTVTYTLNFCQLLLYC